MCDSHSGRPSPWSESGSWSSGHRWSSETPPSSCSSAEEGCCCQPSKCYADRAGVVIYESGGVHREDPDNSITITITIGIIVIIIIIIIINRFLSEPSILVNEPKVRGDLHRHCRGREDGSGT